jgi:hypothetical protein
MIASEAKKLTVGQRVKWSDGSLGTIVDKNWHALQINWDDGQACILQFKNNEPQFAALSVEPRTKAA